MKALTGKLSARHVRTREQDGKTLSYVEGWHLIAEANRIFGHDSWDRETVSTTCVFDGISRRLKAVSYLARVRIRVRAGDTVIVREGTGVGNGYGSDVGEVHESAIKEAETDAMKRALVTFGNPFGLALYDKEQKGVRSSPTGKAKESTKQPLAWLIRSETGEPVTTYTDPVDYCSAVRKWLEEAETFDRVQAFWSHDQATIVALRDGVPQLTTHKGRHYADILGALYVSRSQEVPNSGSPTKTPAAAEDKVADGPKAPTRRAPRHVASGGVTETPRRTRDKDHLRCVSSATSHPDRAWSAAGPRARPVTSNSRGPGRSAGKQATSGSCRSAPATIAPFMTPAMSGNGGASARSTRSPRPRRYGKAHPAEPALTRPHLAAHTTRA